MNNRKKQVAKVIVFNSGVDEWGRPRQSGSIIRYADGLLYLYALRLVQDIRYNDCEYLFITSDTTIEDANQLEIESVKYEVIRVIPSQRKYQVLLKKA